MQGWKRRPPAVRGAVRYWKGEIEVITQGGWEEDLGQGECSRFGFMTVVVQGWRFKKHQFHTWVRGEWLRQGMVKNYQLCM